MASRVVIDRIPLKLLQRYHHATLNIFGDHETLVDALGHRPGFFGPNPVAYLAMIGRRSSIHIGDIEEALINDRSLIRASAFRNSLFLLNTTDYPIYFRGFYAQLRNVGQEKLEACGVGTTLIKRFVHVLEEANFLLPQTHDQICSMLLYPLKRRFSADEERMIVRKLCDLGVLVRTSAKGWKGNDFSYALMRNWLPELSLSTENPESARTEIVRRYLRAYGPATIEDISWWTGLPLQQVQRSLTQLRREGVRFALEGYKEDFYGLRETVELTKAPAPFENEIVFLPPWDPFTLGWSNRRRLVEKDFAPYVYDNFGNACSVIVENGRIIGLWQFRDSSVTMLEFHVFFPYVARRKEVFRLAEKHAGLLATLSGALEVNIFERPLPRTLSERQPGSFLWPLGKELPFKSLDEGLLISPMERRQANKFRNSYLDAENVIRPADKMRENDDEEAVLG